MSVKPIIATEEQELAAKYFTLSNLSLLYLVQNNDLKYGYQRADEIMFVETGATITEEYEYWLSEVSKKNPDSYVIEEWNKVKTKYVNI